MVRGRNLNGARVSCEDSGLAISEVRTSAAGTYLFFDVAIRPETPPGTRELRISTSQGTAKARFDVLAALPPVGRFQGFSPDDVIYLLMPDRFSDGDLSNDHPPNPADITDRQNPRYYHGGDFQGIIDHLSYLKDLGVTALWMTPIYDNVNQPENYQGRQSADYHGYAAADFYGVEEHFGDLRTLEKLVESAHRLGIKVIQDEVANHTGPRHPWVQDSPTPTWFHGTPAHHLEESWQTYTLMDPHASPELQKPVLDGWFGNRLPDLNQDDSEVARYLIQNTLWWIGVAGFDAVREDTVPYVPRRFWRDWMSAIKRQYPQVKVVGEVFNADPALVSFFQGGVARFDDVDTRLDSVFDFPLFYAIRRVFAEGKSIRDLAETLSHDGLYSNARMLVTFAGLHDVRRFSSVPGATEKGSSSRTPF